jgi:hypothetical protein
LKHVPSHAALLTRDGIRFRSVKAALDVAQIVREHAPHAFLGFDVNLFVGLILTRFALTLGHVPARGQVQRFGFGAGDLLADAEPTTHLDDV